MTLDIDVFFYTLNDSIQKKVYMTAATQCVTHVLILLFSCCYYTDGCHWLLNSSYIDKYFDSECYSLQALKGIFTYRAQI